MPIAATVKVAVCPLVMLVLAGWVLIVGAVTGAVTVRMAALLVAVPAELPTVTVNCVPVAEVVSAGVV